MLGVVGHDYGFIDEQHGNAVLDPIRSSEPGVVEEFVINQKQRSAVLWADQDAQQFFVEHNGG